MTLSGDGPRRSRSVREDLPSHGRLSLLDRSEWIPSSFYCTEAVKPVGADGTPLAVDDP